MTQKEKADAYDEIIAKVQKMHDENIDACKACIEELIPSLKNNGNENEKIRKSLIEHFAKFDSSDEWIENISFKKVVDWLENQKEIKCIKDNELSDLLHKTVCRFINTPEIPYSIREEVSKKIIPYIEMLERQPEQKYEWSQEDEEHFESCLDTFSKSYYSYQDDVVWFKSLKEKCQNKLFWKPSEEYLKTLERVIDYLHDYGQNDDDLTLQMLYDQLKSL